ncbi:MAG: hypothetical protein ACJ8F7_02265 [Gemmataceae bacterium]
MPIQVNCPACARPLRVPDNLIGQRVKCPGCLDQFIAAPSLPAAAAPTEEFRAAERPTRPRLDDDEDRRELEGYRPADEAAPPARPARMPRFSDYEEDDDDFDDLPRRRRRRGPNREWAMSKVSGPANGLLAVGTIGIVISVFSFGAGILNVAGPGGGGGGRGGAGGAPGGAAFLAGNAAGNFVGSVVHLGVSILVITGAQKMKNLEGYGLAKAAAIIAIIPCISPCCILGIIFGIQALNVLNESEVREAFGA